MKIILPFVLALTTVFFPIMAHAEDQGPGPRANPPGPVGGQGAGPGFRRGNPPGPAGGEGAGPRFRQPNPAGPAGGPGAGSNFQGANPPGLAGGPGMGPGYRHEMMEQADLNEDGQLNPRERMLARREMQKESSYGSEESASGSPLSPPDDSLEGFHPEFNPPGPAGGEGAGPRFRQPNPAGPAGGPGAGPNFQRPNPPGLAGGPGVGPRFDQGNPPGPLGGPGQGQEGFRNGANPPGPRGGANGARGGRPGPAPRN